MGYPPSTWGQALGTPPWMGLLTWPQASEWSPHLSFKCLCDLGPSTPPPLISLCPPHFSLLFYTVPPSICLIRLLSYNPKPSSPVPSSKVFPDPCLWHPAAPIIPFSEHHHPVYLYLCVLPSLRAALVECLAQGTVQSRLW